MHTLRYNIEQRVYDVIIKGDIENPKYFSIFKCENLAEAAALVNYLNGGKANHDAGIKVLNKLKEETGYTSEYYGD